MEFRQLRAYEAVVTHRTVTDAAVALGLAPSSVSEQIRGLERSLGVTHPGVRQLLYAATTP